MDVIWSAMILTPINNDTEIIPYNFGRLVLNSKAQILRWLESLAEEVFLVSFSVAGNEAENIVPEIIIELRRLEVERIGDDRSAPPTGGRFLQGLDQAGTDTLATAEFVRRFI
ncbi:MAG: hypothetical protein WA996_19515 [Candidatus Promineifilaceae bacterium]